MKKKWFAGIMSTVLLISVFSPAAHAAFETNLEAFATDSLFNWFFFTEYFFLQWI